MAIYEAGSRIGDDISVNSAHGLGEAQARQKSFARYVQDCYCKRSLIRKTHLRSRDSAQKNRVIALELLLFKSKNRWNLCLE
jgi:hypothetical protein